MRKPDSYLSTTRSTLIVALLLGAIAVAPARATAGLKVAPGTLGFGKVAFHGVGETSPSSPKSVTISDPTSGAAISGLAILIAGTDPSDFQITNNTCSADLAAGANCSVTLTFTPTRLGTRTAKLSISDTASSSAGKVALSGDGTMPTTLTVTDTAELYQPDTERFIATNALNQERAFQTATLLPDGDVLVAGGQAGSVLNSAELYGPTNQAFTRSESTMNAPRTAHTATLLSSGPEAGMVLLAGGSPSLSQVSLLDQGALNSAELYDSVNDTFTPTSGHMVAARSEHTATFLDPQLVNGPLAGRVLIAGGMSDKGNVLATAELYDPASSTFTRTSGAMSTARRLHAAALISGCGCAADGRVLIAGGQGSDGSAIRTAELFDPATGTFTSTGEMAEARFFLTATGFGNGQVLIAGGDPAEDSEIYDPASGKFQLIRLPDNIPTGAANAAALLQSGQVLVTGGGEPPSSAAGFTDANPTATLFDSQGSPTAVGQMLIARVGHTATALGDGTVLVAGGETPQSSVNAGVVSGYSWKANTLKSPTWTKVPELP
jgi:centrosomal CEP192-like protein/galactose oxidase-like protein